MLRNGNETKQQRQKRIDKEQNKRLGKGGWMKEEKATAEEKQRIKEENLKRMKELGIIK